MATTATTAPAPPSPPPTPPPAPPTRASARGPPPSPRPPPRRPSHPRRVALVRRHFARKGYRVRSGLQFGCELVLYADDPDRVHSDFCVHVPGGGTCAGDGGEGGEGEEDGGEDRLDWRTIQSLARSMPLLRKTLIVARVREVAEDEEEEEGEGIVLSLSEDGERDRNDVRDGAEDEGGDAGGDEKPPRRKRYVVDELAIATEHAPFRHKRKTAAPGGQVKPRPGRR